MKHASFARLAQGSSCPGCAALNQDSTATGNPAEMKVAFDITDGARAPLIVKLETIETTRKQLIDRASRRRSCSHSAATHLFHADEPRDGQGNPTAPMR
jgi:hypothetical protein